VNERPTSDAELSNQLRQYLQTRLPDYMVPSAFVLLDELPLTPNGKVDRRALPAPEGDSQLTAYVAPRNAIEQALCEVWQEVLKRERVGINDNFFTLGGDSILSIRVVAMLKTRGLTLGINEIFQHQTVALLADHVTQQADSLISKMSNDAAEQRAKWTTAGKAIEEGVF
jgi:aryl carrier-like protein